MASATVSGASNLLGDNGTIVKSFSFSRTVSADGFTVKDPTLAAAKVGQLTTRTDDNTGTLTMDSGHGITTGARLDLYWTGGRRYNITVGTVATNSVPIDLGAGDALPANLTAITAMVPQSEAFSFETSDMVALFCGVPIGAIPATVMFVDATNGDAVIRLNGGVDSIWDSASAAPSPLADTDGSIRSVFFSHGDSTASRQINVAALLN
jgi:hypothetical protein